MYSIRPVTDISTWEAFIAAQPFSPFLQSWKYGDFFAALGEKSWVWGVYEGDRLCGGSIVVSTHAKRGNFLYLPYGPVIAPDHQDRAGFFTAFTAHLKTFAKTNGYDFIRMSPFLDDTPDLRQIVADYGFRPAPIHILAETTWLLDVTPDEETLLANMNKNHRNLIRRCLKEGARIEMSATEGSLQAFNDMLDETTKRHKFHRFSRSYITREFQTFQPEAILFNAYLPDGSLDASAVIMYYANMAAYRHGASRMQNSKVPTSYLLQWEAIREAKRRGIQWYNFWGIAPADADKSHPFHGFTHFKKGFGGVQKDLLPCHDLPISKKYWFTWTIETIRRLKRGF